MRASFKSAIAALSLTLAAASSCIAEATARVRPGSFAIPNEYLQEPEAIPDFWVTDSAGVNRFLDEQVKKKLETIGMTAGGRPIRAVSYGKPRSGSSTTTFSGGLSLTASEVAGAAASPVRHEADALVNT